MGRCPETSRIARRRLLASSSAAAAIFALSSGAAHAQAFQGTPTVASGTVNFNRTTPGTETITLDTPIATINWAPSDTTGTGTIDFLPSGNSALFQNNATATADFLVINRIIPTDPTRSVALNGLVDGVLNSLSGPAVQGGSVWFYSPGGLLIGGTGAINVGGLLLTANDPVLDGAGSPFGGGGLIQLNGATDSRSAVTVGPGASISATPEGGYVIMAAPRVTQGGAVSVNGQAAYVAGEQINLTITNGLFDISVPVGSFVNSAIPGDEVTLAHTGSTTGPASSGAGDAHGIYMLAFSKNAAVQGLLQVNGNVGFATPVSATIENGAIVLSANYNIAGGQANSLSANDADFVVTGAGNLTSDVTMRATRLGDVVAQGGSTLTFEQDLDIQSFIAARDINPSIARARAMAGSTLAILGNLSLSAPNVGTTSGVGGQAFANPGGTVDLFAAATGTIQIGGDVSLSSSGGGGDGDTSFASPAGAEGIGGNVALTANGAMTIGGNLILSSIGDGGGGATADDAAGVGQGGDTTITVGGGSLTVTGSTDLVSIGQSGRFRQGSNGAGNGGTTSVLVNGGTASFADLFLTTSGTGSSGTNGGVGTGGLAFVRSQAGGSLTTSGDLALDQLSVGGGGTVAGGGVGTLAPVSLTAAGGNISVAGSVFLTANTQGGSGGSGASASVSGGLLDFIALTGSVLDVDGNVTLSATASTGSGATGGNATGGFATIGANGGTITIGGTASEFVDGFGGSATAGVAGSGTGGSVATARADNGGSLSVAGTTLISANGFAGSGVTGGGTGTGGQAFSLATDGSTVQLGGLTISADGSAGTTSSGIAGIGQGGSALVQAFTTSPSAPVPTITINGDLNLNANGTGANGLVGGLGLGGSAHVLATGRGTVSATGNSNFSATGQGGSGETGGEGRGGSALAATDAGALQLGFVNLRADGFGGFGTAVAGGRGVGGVASIQILSAATPDVLTTGNAFLSAIGQGGGGSATAVGQVAAGGEGVGGFSLILARAGTLTTGFADVRSEGFGGSGGSAFSIPATGGAGGLGTGGTAEVAGLGGAILLGSLTLDAGGLGGGGGSGADGGAGGNGVSGLATLHGDSGTITVTGFSSINTDANAGFGGSGTSGVGGAGGAAFGGTAIATSLGGAVTLGDVTTLAGAFGGTGGAGATGGGAGGAGNGGVTEISAIGGSLVVTNGTTPGFVSQLTEGFGGDGGSTVAGAGGAGGLGTGGQALVRANGSLALGSVSLLAIGEGGEGGDGGVATSGGGAGGGGAGGAAVGGFARAESIGGSLTMTSGSISAYADGGGGGDGGVDAAGTGRFAGGAGGNAIGGKDSGSPLIPGGAYLVADGGTVAFDNMLLNARGSGGAGGLGGVGGAGGTGDGGFAIITSRSTLMTGSSATIDAAGDGGAGGQGDLPSGGGIGGVGGIGRGGVSLLTSEIANSSAINLGSATVFSAGSGGGGGAGGPGVSAGGVGGAGGAGVGGDARINALTGSLAVNFAQAFGAGIGGAGGVGGNADPATGTGGGGGAGGAGTGSTALVSAAGGALSLTNLNLFTNADGGAGGAGGLGAASGTLGAGGNATAGVARLVSSAGSLNVDFANLFSLHNPGLGSTPGLGTGGSVEVLALGNPATINNLQASTFGPGGGSGLLVADNARLTMAGFSSFTVGGTMTIEGRNGGIIDAADLFLQAASATVSQIGVAPADGLPLLRTGFFGADLIGNFSATTPISSSGDFSVDAGGTISVTNLTAGLDIELDGLLGVTAGQLVAGNSVSADSAGNIMIAQATAATAPPSTDPDFPGSIGIRAGGSLTLGSGSARNLIGLAAYGGPLTANSLSTADNVMLFGGGDIDIGSITIGPVPGSIDPDGLGPIIFVGNSSQLAPIGQDVEDVDLLALLAAPPVASGGNIRIGQIAGSGVLAAAAGGNTTFGAPAGLNVAYATAGGLLKIDAGGLLAVSGLIDASQIELGSTDLALTANAEVGSSDTDTLLLVARNSAVRLGGATQGGGYTLDNSETSLLQATAITLAAPGTGNGAAVTVADLPLAGSATPGGGTSLFRLDATGNVDIVGKVELLGATATDRVELSATNRISLVTPGGGIRLQSSQGVLGGVLALNADTIIVASGSAAADVASASSLAARAARLAVNDGAVDAAGFLQAGTIGLSAGSGLYVQNSGDATLNAGATAGSGGFIITSRGQTPTEMVLYGRQANGGGFITDGALISAIDFQTQQGSAGIASGSTVNGCLIASASCGDAVPPEVVAPIREAVASVSNVVTALIAETASEQSEAASSASVTRAPNIVTATLMDFASLVTAERVDSPTTGAGNEQLWQNEEGAEAEDATP